jgi:hypothetical protein
MNPEKIWIVLAILVLTLLLSNALVFAVVRGWSKGNLKWFDNSNQSLNLLKKETDSAEELSRQVRALRNDDKTDP